MNKCCDDSIYLSTDSRLYPEYDWTVIVCQSSLAIWRLQKQLMACLTEATLRLNRIRCCHHGRYRSSESDVAGLPTYLRKREWDANDSIYSND
ncbi:MAG: hypothetical protein P8N76_03230 [Pirellulaceae bacterium]|nr:hypothetical protein [Pirellulaceae bacterium]